MKKFILSFTCLFLFGILQSGNAQGCLNCPEGQQLGPNLVVNGNFSAGNTGFFSDLPVETGVCTIQAYDVQNQASVKCPNWPNGLWDNTVGNATGSYLIVDGPFNATNVAPNRVWQQNFVVQGGRRYEFEFFWLPDFGGTGFASLQVFAGNTPISPVFGPINSANWQQICFGWVAPGSFPIGVQLSIRQVGAFAGFGFDYGIDDISFRCCEDIPTPPCEVFAKWDVEVNPDGCKAQFTNFSQAGQGTTILGYCWDFGDGNTSTDVNPCHFYDASGTYNVCLTVFGIDENGDCCTDTFCRKVEVECEQTDCRIDIWGINIGINNQNCTLLFNAGVSANRPIMGYFWDFGDGSTSTTGPTVSHTFPGTGIYNVCVTVVAKDGEKCCSETRCRQVGLNCGISDGSGGDALVNPLPGDFFPEEDKASLKVFPNPATQEVNIQFDADIAGEHTVIVTNIQGQTVLRSAGDNASGISKVQLNTSDLSAGTYFVQVLVSGKLLTEKLIIQ